MTETSLNVARVAQSRSIPFALELDADPQDVLMRTAVKAKLAAQSDKPIAMYDAEQRRPYLEYPDGRKVYELV